LDLAHTSCRRTRAHRPRRGPILKHYATVSEVRTKADSSPVTKADEEAEALILDSLTKLEPKVPVVAEESVAKGRIPRLGARFFLVDPLDGTKEFLQKNGEFTVNIALIEHGRPIAGVVIAPAKARAFVGDGDNGAFELAAPEALPLEVGAAHPIRARRLPADGLIAVVSRTHRDTKTEQYLEAYRVAGMVAAGSSLKFCLVASGDADLYPRHGTTMEWDTAAGQAVLESGRRFGHHARRRPPDLRQSRPPLCQSSLRRKRSRLVRFPRDLEHRSFGASSRNGKAAHSSAEQSVANARAMSFWSEAAAQAISDLRSRGSVSSYPLRFPFNVHCLGGLPDACQ
jgi:3'(2'),5'-bisphosphate nucleotidase